MPNFKRGQIVNVPCEIQPGAFPGERLVTIHTDKGALSGFVKAEHVTTSEDAFGSIRGTVVEVAPDAVKVRLPGSFFTSASGMTSVSPSWANKHLTPAMAA